MTRTPRQGHLELLQDPIAQALLRSTVPARLAYNWTDGTPRVVPIGFHWTGQELVMGTPANAPKLKSLHGTRVALSIDTNDFPYQVLLLRGTATVRVMDGIAPEYVLMARRCLGEGADGWLTQVEAMLPTMGGMARVAITPDWVRLLDFVQRFPSAIENAMMTRPSG